MKKSTKALPAGCITTTISSGVVFGMQEVLFKDFSGKAKSKLNITSPGTGRVTISFSILQNGIETTIPETNFSPFIYTNPITKSKLCDHEKNN